MRMQWVVLASVVVLGAAAVSGQSQRQPASLDDVVNEIRTHRDAELQLRTQESQLSAEIANEQNRWQDFNSRLDELEKSLR